MKIIGVILVILTNCCYIANNYAVKWAGLGEVVIGRSRTIDGRGKTAAPRNWGNLG